MVLPRACRGGTGQAPLGRSGAALESESYASTDLKPPGIQRNLTETDAALSALLDDLRERGLLESTLVLWMAEFGRTPKMGNSGGRDHWPHCYSFLMAGAGTKGGQLYGSSDRQAAYPREKPVPPEDIHATLYHALGIPKDTIIHDTVGRPIALCDGTALASLF